jgi:hypothetical protein
MIDAGVLSQLSRWEKERIYVALSQQERQRRAQPDLYGGNPLDFITKGMRQCREESWRGWRTILKAAFALPMDVDEVAFFREVAGGRDLPRRRVRELWLIVGRRGGKDSVASLIAVNAARFADCVALRPGERALVACFATDRDQAGIVHGYIRGYFEENAALRRWVVGDLPRTYQGTLELTNRVEIKVATNNFRAPRGRAIPCAIFDECAYWRDENSATPDKETYRAVLPGMATIPDALLVGISSPYKQSGLLFEKYKNHFGRDSDDVLVIQASTRQMNPMIDALAPGLIDRALEEDPEAAAAEWLAQFRKDLADYVPREVAEAAVMRGVPLIPYAPGRGYVAFADPSGGSRDSFTLAIAHEERGRGVLDLLRETRAPFAPGAVVEDYATTLRNYGLRRVTGDHYAGAWPADAFREHGVQYEISELTKNDVYREFLPHLNSGKVDLLDNPRLINQLCGLERRTVRGGRDSIDHAPLAHDDLINAAAGALVMALDVGDRPLSVPPELTQRLAGMRRVRL